MELRVRGIVGAVALVVCILCLWGSVELNVLSDKNKRESNARTAQAFADLSAAIHGIGLLAGACGCFLLGSVLLVYIRNDKAPKSA